MDQSVFNHGIEPLKEHYRNACEQILDDMPEPLGRSVATTVYVDASHATNKMTRGSHSGYVLFVNKAPISWYSKRQNTVESSPFSSEFIAMKTCMESIHALRYKLRMFGVPVNDATRVLCDNESVVKNSSSLASTLNKNHSSIAFHLARWAVAAGGILIGWIPTNFNIADSFIKCHSAHKRDALFGSWTY